MYYIGIAWQTHTFSLQTLHLRGMLTYSGYYKLYFLNFKFAWYDVWWMQGVREGSVFTAYRESAAYDEANLRFRYLAGLEDEREPAYAHYFFYKEVAIQIIATLQCTHYCVVNF